MFADLCDFDDGKDFEADLCIIGAGAAGISIARAFIGSSVSVCLVESGGLKPEPDTQALYRGQTVNDASFPLDVVRARRFGGSTELWGAQCRPLDGIDFEHRSWVPNSGWPFGLEAIAPYYSEANEVCGLGPNDYGVEPWQAKGLDATPFEQSRVSNRLWQIGSPPMRFGARYRPALQRAANIRVLLHANAVEIDANAEMTRIDAVRLKSLDGPGATVRARTFVLACGGIENPRLLLASTNVSVTGLGNGYDLVGRFFMDHLHAPLALAVPKTSLSRFAVYHGGIAIDGTKVRLKAGLPEAVQRREELLNTCLNISVGVAGDRGPGYLALKRLVAALFFRTKHDTPWEDVRAVLRDVDGLVSGVCRRVFGPRVLWLTLNSEQVPNRDSRITLDRRRDALGMPQSRLDWRLTTLEKRTARHLCLAVGEELERLGIARTQVQDWLLTEDNDWPALEGQYHHIGTTRMHEDPKHGVTDSNCRVHGLANLYVAGSSVFPTSGYANPTLTLVALALRLADHLKRELA